MTLPQVSRAQRIRERVADAPMSLATLFASAMILATTSEALYYEISAPLPLLTGWYLVPAAAFIWFLRLRAVSRFSALVLAGACYGFIVEGVLVAVLYEMPWFTISYTSLAWHMLVSVGVCWLGIGSALRARRWWILPSMMVGLGVLLGVWWHTWEARDPVDLLVSLATATTWMALGHVLLAVVPLRLRRPDRWSVRFVSAVCLGLFVLGPGVAIPWAVLVIAPLLVACWVGAGPRRPDSRAPAHRLLPVTPVHDRRLLRVAWLGLLPLSAAAVYAMTGEAGAEVAQVVIAGPQVIGGYLVFGWAVVVGFRARRLGTRVS